MSRAIWLGLGLLLASSTAWAEHGAHTIISNTEIHFFADVNAQKYFGSQSLDPSSELYKTPSTFRLGSLDFYVFSHLGQFSFLSETGFEPTPDGYSLDVERLQATWSPQSWFQFSIGRYHTPFGYWNTAYHHGRWLFTTVDAPLLFRFEDEGGPLPVHTVGVLLFGDLSLGGSVVLHYDLGAGNGRGPTPDPPQKLQDINEGKSVLFGLHLQAGGFRAGAAGWWDNSYFVYPAESARTPMIEEILAADITYTTAPWEVLLEGAVVRHLFSNLDVSNYGAYAQIAYQVADRWKPYARAEIQIIPKEEIYLAKLVARPSPDERRALAGVRFDPVEVLAVKLEGGVHKLRGIDLGGFIQLQFAFVY